MLSSANLAAEGRLDLGGGLPLPPNLRDVTALREVRNEGLRDAMCAQIVDGIRAFPFQGLQTPPVLIHFPTLSPFSLGGKMLDEVHPLLCGVQLKLEIILLRIQHGDGG